MILKSEIVATCPDDFVKVGLNLISQHLSLAGNIQVQFLNWISILTVKPFLFLYLFFIHSGH